MDMQFLQALLSGHFSAILVVLLVLLAWWRGGFASIDRVIAKIEQWYDHTREDAQRMKVFRIAQTAYNFANDEGRRLAKLTDTKVDDVIVDKGVIALKAGLALMEKMGLKEDGAEDILKYHFGELHDAEEKAKALLGKLPGSEE